MSYGPECLSSRMKYMPWTDNWYLDDLYNYIRWVQEWPCSLLRVVTPCRVCASHQLGSAGLDVLLPRKWETQHNKASILLEADATPLSLFASHDSDQQTKKGVTILTAMKIYISGTYGDGRRLSGIELKEFPKDSLNTCMSGNGY